MENIQLPRTYMCRHTTDTQQCMLQGTTTICGLSCFLVCNPKQLTDKVITKEENQCSPHYSTLEIEGGFVCYSGTTTGSTALYYCSDCGYNSLKKTHGSFLRVCGGDGQWNGTVPQCQCGKCNYAF